MGSYLQCSRLRPGAVLQIKYSRNLSRTTGSIAACEPAFASVLVGPSFNPVKPHLLIVAAALLLHTACNRQQTPGAKAKEGLAQAREGIAQAREGVEQTRTSLEAMSERSEAMQKQIAKQHAEIDQLIEKRLELLRRQIDALGHRVSRLPAERETAIRPQLDELSPQRDAVSEKLKTYRDAPPGQSAERLRELDETLDRFQKETERVEAAMETPPDEGKK